MLENQSRRAIKRCLLNFIQRSAAFANSNRECETIGSLTKIQVKLNFSLKPARISLHLFYARAGPNHPINFPPVSLCVFTPSFPAVCSPILAPRPPIGRFRGHGFLLAGAIPVGGVGRDVLLGLERFGFMDGFVQLVGNLGWRRRDRRSRDKR